MKTSALVRTLAVAAIGLSLDTLWAEVSAPEGEQARRLAS